MTCIVSAPLPALVIRSLSILSDGLWSVERASALPSRRHNTARESPKDQIHHHGHHHHHHRHQHHHHRHQHHQQQNRHYHYYQIHHFKRVVVTSIRDEQQFLGTQVCIDSHDGSTACDYPFDTLSSSS